MKELVTEAVNNNLPNVLAFVDEQLKVVSCPMKTQIQVDVAVEELFVNIANYAYDEAIGKVIVQVSVYEAPLCIEITFIDKGKQYDPLATSDPDITIPAKKRKKGGLGVFMTKKYMDDIRYEYRDGHNILTVTKKL